MTLQIPPGEFQAYIFDCDGTLADTMPLHYQAWLTALGRLGCPFPEDLFYSLGGVPAPGVVEFLNARHGFAMPVAATAKYKEALFEKLIPQVKPIPEVIAFMDSLAGRYPLAVASGGLKPLVLATLEALGIRQRFQAVVTYEDVAHGKPAPDTYLEAARQLGVDPARCLVFEDTPLGIDSGVAAGMQTVLVASGPVVTARP
jgi:HAD superfamily hydrolase (TIGR01509 family)